MPIDQIILIYPHREGRILGKGEGSPYTLMRLASLVPDEIPVHIIDENITAIPYERMTKNTLVGITAKTLAIDRARSIAAQAHERSAAVVVGGTHVTLSPDEVSEWADATVVGEAYHTWQQIIRDFDSGNLKRAYIDQSWAELRGIARLTDRVIKQVDENHRYWTPYLEITRGCPRDCSFCTAIRVSGRVMRLRPMDEVVEEIQRRRIKRFFLTDDNFGLNFRLDPNYMEECFQALKKLPLQGWTAQAEMMVGNYPDLLGMAHEAHLDKFFIGFESVNTGNRRELGGKSKGNIEQYRQVIREIHKHGIGVVGLFVFGFDHDTPQVFQDTWNFIRESELDSVSVTILTPYPGTDTRAELVKENRLIPGVPWSLHDTAHVTYYPKQMTVEQLREGYDWICRKLYSPGSIVARGVRNLRRYPPKRMPAKAFSSFSTDIGYRITYSYRDMT